MTLFPNREMLDLVLVDGKARGIVVRNLLTGELESHVADAVCLATGGYGTAYYLSTNAVNSNVTAAWRCYKRGALFANPCFTQIHPTCIPVSGDHQSQAHADEREPAQRRARLGAEDGRRQAAAAADPRSRARLLPRAALPELRQPRAARRRVARRQGGLRRGPRRRRDAAWPSIWTSPTPSAASARTPCARATATCSRCTRRSPTRIRTRCRCGSTPPSTTRWAACGWTTT